MDWRGGSWLWPYLGGMAVISFIRASDFGGMGYIPFGWDILVVAAFSLAIYFYAISVRLTPEEVRSHVADARDEAEEEEVCSRCKAPVARGELSRPWLPIYVSLGNAAPPCQEAGNALGSS